MKPSGLFLPVVLIALNPLPSERAWSPVAALAPSISLAWAVTGGFSSRLLFAGCGMCGGCGGGSFEQHSFFVSSGGFKYGSNHDCTPSTGCPHDSCWILTERPRQPLDELVEGLKAGRVDVVENLLTGSRDYLAFNAERRAIQLYSPCAPDIVVAHLPLNVVQLAAAMRLSPQPAESD